MTARTVRFALATAGVVAAVGGISLASAASPPPASPQTNTNGYLKDQCKNGGWVALGFRNQGQCVSFFAKQQH
jgi:hypothetical protein